MTATLPGITETRGTPDYYSVSRPVGKNAYGFVCNVLARDGGDALRIAKAHGLTVPGGSYARRIGRDGYAAALRAAGATVIEHNNLTTKTGNRA
jgi:hypothetical protein